MPLRAEYAMAAKGLNPDRVVRERIIEGARAALERLAAEGRARKIMEWPNTWWGWWFRVKPTFRFVVCGPSRLVLRPQ